MSDHKYRVGQLGKLGMSRLENKTNKRGIRKEDSVLKEGKLINRGENLK